MKKQTKNSSNRLLYVLFATFYCLFLFFALFWNPFRLNIYAGIHRNFYLENYCNFLPFHTVMLYINAIRQGTLKLISVLNLVGNLFLFAPFPILFARKNPIRQNWYLYLPLSFLVPALAETLQFLFMTGSCDIDDCILNFIGLIFSFILLQILDKQRKKLYNEPRRRKKK